MNLWLLTPTRVGPDKGLEAKRFEPNGSVQVAQSSATSASRPAPYAAPRSTTDTTTPKPVQMARNEPPAHVRPQSTTTGRKVQRLPQTATNLPMFYLVSTTALAGAALLNLRRRSRVAA